MTTAVTGSRAPRIADGVEPMRSMEMFMRNSDNTVGSRASWKPHAHCLMPWSIITGSRAKKENRRMVHSPKNTIQNVKVTDE